MVAGSVVERPLTLVVPARLEACPRAVALGVADDQQQFDEPGRHRVTGRRQQDLAALVEIGARCGVGGDVAQRCQGTGRRRRPAGVVHEHRAQTLANTADEDEVVRPQIRVGPQQATGHQPRPGFVGIGEPVRAVGQLNGVDQRLNAAQWFRRWFGLDVTEPMRDVSTTWIQCRTA